MRRLYVAKHASPVVTPEMPAERWTLASAGAAEAARLAEVARRWLLRAICSSTEPKAVATAQMIASASGLIAAQSDQFDELRMPKFIDQPDAFAAAVRAIFESPAVPVDGAEPATVAAERFTSGIADLTDFPACVVSHGRVIAAWLAETGRIEDAFAFWQALPLAGYVVIDLDDPAQFDGPFASDR